MEDSLGILCLVHGEKPIRAFVSVHLICFFIFDVRDVLFMFHGN